MSGIRPLSGIDREGHFSQSAACKSQPVLVPRLLKMFASRGIGSV